MGSASAAPGVAERLLPWRESRPWLEACGLQPWYRQGRRPSAGSCPASIPASAVAAPPINEARATDFLGYKFGVVAFSVE
jgi:hypothetical protein